MKYLIRFFEGIQYLWRALLRLPIYFHLIGMVCSFLLFCVSVYNSIQHGAYVARLEKHITLEEEKLVRLEQIYIENLAEWETLSSPYVVKKLVELYLPDMKPAFVRHSIGDLPLPLNEDSHEK